jgi:hypothetical protein
MIGRKIQGLEVVIVVFDLGSFGNAVTQGHEDFDDVSGHQMNRVHAPHGWLSSRQRHVHGCQARRLPTLVCRQLGIELLQPLFYRFFETIDLLTEVAPLSGRNIFELPQQRSDDPLLAAEPSYPQGVPVVTHADSSGLVLESSDLLGETCLRGSCPRVAARHRSRTC